MNNDLVSLSELFDQRIYRIPDYQRGYAWTIDQINDFWDDLANLSEERNHYTGMLSLKKLDKATWEKWEEERWIIRDAGYVPYHVVDGQQRLTTFIILVNSILRFAESKGIDYLCGKSTAEIRERYIVEYRKPTNQLFAYKFGYEKDNPSFKFLRFSILGEGDASDLEETFYTLNLERAKETFDSRVKELYESEGLEGLESLYRKLTQHLQFNIHYIQDDFDVFVAFETMNNRGKKLSNLEILKNRLIYLTTIYPDSVLDEDEKRKMRNDINDAWKEVYKYLGKNKRHPLNDDEYLRNHWSLFFKYSRKKGDDYVKFLLGDYFTSKAVYGIVRPSDETPETEEDVERPYEEYEDYLEDTDIEDGVLKPKEISDYVQSLKEVAPYWYFSFNPTESTSFTDEEKKWISKLNRIGINYFRPLVVASFINKEVIPEQRIRLFKLIEKSIFVYFRMARWQASYQSTVAYNSARELMKGESSIEDVIESWEEKFQSVKAEAVETFVTKIQGLFKNADGFYSWSDLRYFLFEYEMALYDATHVPLLTDWGSFTASEKDKISIEHIFPQTPTKFYWRNKFRDYTSAEYHQLANSLGNLLALSQSVNSALQNDAFEDKKNGKSGRRGYLDGSHSEKEVAKNADWTPKEILLRGFQLLAFMEKRWDISLTDESKWALLGLEFMKEPREESPELNKEDYSEFPQIENSKSPLRDMLAANVIAIMEKSEDAGTIIMLPSANSHIRFTSPTVRENVGLGGSGEWSGIKDLIAFEIQNTVSDGVSAVAFVGPSKDQELRLRWHNFAKKTKVLGGKYRKMKTKWDPIFKPVRLASPRSAYDSDEDYIHAAIDGLTAFLSDRFPEIERAFREAPNDLSDPAFTESGDSDSERSRHGFRDIEFESSLTGHRYLGGTEDDGTLRIEDLTLGEVVESHAEPSKRAIVGQAIIDLGGQTGDSDTLYQRYHALTKLVEGEGQNWLIPHDPNTFDLDRFFDSHESIDFKQSTNVKVGDVVYVYSSGKERRLTYITLAMEVDKPTQAIDDSEYIVDGDKLGPRKRYMELKLLKRLNFPELGFADLKEHGLKGQVQGPCHITKELQEYIDSIVGKVG